MNAVNVFEILLSQYLTQLGEQAPVVQQALLWCLCSREFSVRQAASRATKQLLAATTDTTLLMDLLEVTITKKGIDGS